jgi:hypothetical protein
MSGTVVRANIKTKQYTSPTSISENANRTALAVYFNSTGTIALGGGDPVSFGVNGVYEPLVVPTSDVAITGTDYVVAIGGETLT